ncbi:MAG: radical SAM protein [bacterium]
MPVLLELMKKDALMPPLGLATVAALTPREYEVEIVDEEIEAIDFGVKYDIVGIAGYTYNAARMFELSDEFRKRGILTVGGGPYCKVDTAACRPHFDVLMIGEAEYTWPRFLADWEQGKYSDCYVADTQIDMKDSPVPRWDLIPLEKYSGAILQTARGCPYDCEFCDIVSLFGRTLRHKPIENVLREVEALSQRGSTSVWIADDNFNGNKGYAKDLLRALADLNHRLKHPMSYTTSVTLTVSRDTELLDLFKRANFKAVLIGIETPNTESLISANKLQNTNLDLREAIQRVQARGMFVIAGMCVGFDSDDLDIFRQQSDFLIEAGLMVCVISLLQAPKGTKLWRRLKKEHRLVTTFDDGNFYADTNIIPKLMEKEVLEEQYGKLLREVFSYEHFLKRLGSYVQQLRWNAHNPEVQDTRRPSRNAVNADDLKIALRVLRHYLFSTNGNKRRFFLSALRISLRNGLGSLPQLIEFLIWFKSQREFIRKTYPQ